MPNSKIVYTYTDEAPALATHSFLPVVEAYLKPAGIAVETKDISLASRILSHFSDCLTDAQKVPDALGELGVLAKSPDANIVKLPNISASVPQLKAAISELQQKGFKLPDFPANPKSDAEKDAKARYSKVLGSAVNPVLREGNSDRRVAGPVKEFARKNPHSMGAWSSDSKSHVAHMQHDDFYGSEQSCVMPREGTVRIEWHKNDGSVQVLKESVPVLQGEVIDSSRMKRSALRSFFQDEMKKSKDEGLLLSLHMKATMMKVSDPVIFGEAVGVFFQDVLGKYSKELEEINFDARNGIGDLYSKLSQLPDEARASIERDLLAVYENNSKLAMVDSDKGITNLHVPSDVIIDASMPACIRSSGKMLGRDGELHDTKALIPDRSYAGVYQATIEYCKENGAFDVKTMGSVANVGLMAKKAEEYGSHDKTFVLEGDGFVKVVDSENKVLMEHDVSEGDIWRMCQTKDVAIQDWVKLAVARAKATGTPAVFWLDSERAHDRNLIQKIESYLPNHETAGLEISVMNPIEATKFSMERMTRGEDTISVTGNVLRDYLTDLFPILELGTSAKMLSIVPLLAGGGLYETGAGGSAPKHVEQFVKEGHLRWDSLGEFLALAVSLEDLGRKSGNKTVLALANSLDQATAKFLDAKKSPSRKVGELDNRGSHFYLSLYWAEAMSIHSDAGDVAKTFVTLAANLKENENKITDELTAAQGSKVDIDGYYFADKSKISSAMRPSATWNSLLERV